MGFNSSPWTVRWNSEPSRTPHCKFLAFGSAEFDPKAYIHPRLLLAELRRDGAIASDGEDDNEAPRSHAGRCVGLTPGSQNIDCSVMGEGPAAEVEAAYGPLS